MPISIYLCKLELADFFLWEDLHLWQLQCAKAGLGCLALLIVLISSTQRKAELVWAWVSHRYFLVIRK